MRFMPFVFDFVFQTPFNLDCFAEHLQFESALSAMKDEKIHPREVKENSHKMLNTLWFR